MTKARHRRGVRAAIAVGVAVLAAGCDGGAVKVSGAPTVTVPAADPSAPTVTLGVAPTLPPSSAQVTVRAGDAPASLSLTSKDGAVNVVLAGTDQESGLLRVELLVGGYTLSCEGEVCRREGPLGAVDPGNVLDLQQASAGEVAPAGATLARAFDLARLLPRPAPAPGTSFTAVWTLTGEVTNQLGARARTPAVTVTYTESA